METEKRTIQFKCRFCGKETGSLVIEAVPGSVISPEHLGFADSRCNECRAEKGCYKRMTEVYDRDISHEGYEEFIAAAGYEIGAFVEAAIVRAPEQFAGVHQHDYPEVQEHCERIFRERGLDKLDPHTRAKVIRAASERNPGAKRLRDIPHEHLKE